MECQNIINLLGNTLNQLTKFRTKNWVEINDNLNRMCKTNNQITFKSSMFKFSLGDYSHAYIPLSGTISV